MTVANPNTLAAVEQRELILSKRLCEVADELRGAEPAKPGAAPLAVAAQAAGYRPTLLVIRVAGALVLRRATCLTVYAVRRTRSLGGRAAMVYLHGVLRRVRLPKIRRKSKHDGLPA
jgi:hypothetical protein